MDSVNAAIERGRAALDARMQTLAGRLGYTDTAYALPVTYGLTGLAVQDAEEAREAYRQSGGNPLVACECLMAAEGGVASPYTGFIPDTVLRRLGYTLVDGSVVGLGLIVGTPENPDAAAAICREMQEKYMLTFLAGGVVEALFDAGVRLGLDYRLVPLGPQSAHGIHFADIIARIAMMFGGVRPGDVQSLLDYAARRAKAFVVAFPGLTDEEIAFVDSLRALGVPILAVGDSYEGGEWIPVNPADAVQTGMDLLGIKVAVTAIPIPMACSPAFEGKSIRKEEMYVEFGGGRTPAFELLRMRPRDEIEDGAVTVVGPDVDAVPEGGALPLAILVDVAGAKMKVDYEPVLERRIHTFINYGEGSWHVAQRDIIWVRLSKDAVAKGVKIRDIGTLLAHKFKMEFPELIDAIQVTLVTDGQKVQEMLPEAREIYARRDERIAGMKDDDVETFYSCTLCQTFAPSHVCIITPERPALCGAITWLDARIAHEISPAGANQPVAKGEVVDAILGEFVEVNRFVKKASHGEVDRISLYSLLENPMTACGCFECIAAIVPEVNGVLIVSRDFSGETPLGMTFSTLAGTIGGGAQTPGFIGISKSYILSDRFIQAEGGIVRVVWMPSSLKEELGDRLRAQLARQGMPDLFDRIADEVSAPTIEDLIEYLERVGHPVLGMKPLI
ncbi:MAG TPA: acetyl-CoA decarbonylase/synthase complex subunit alpha/beta [Candidatus Methanoculleus thermohydrogenotrophicum]|jgi:acetyl-CoA decarbonylase/synthase complex subunit beta|nr:acetyl-CoA decarbonylase/synthase complex subunit alpha/beta [Candidatus Methanoculleus thermohydrogenotrophicum]NLM82563.1 CO dehydrogenase/CO-methylating acetyl-CoA synthase complex subunit beta [Candidatus Methanoculleus thermohydrogenotrophicum]HOB18201.1 acetyl-CoA decarbonylase/synthase complex subunit alpha/beta [Candidatus Methanoculleus thermohydrogenotrophicum]HPZ37750.1 acetyl-CoA decarbonylase/synthase complex subunit alpha/beta [Candidatus Methanoculleus thermohydrogenotrophicum]